MNDDIISRLQAAENDEERQWITLEFSLQYQPLLVREAVWAAAIPHWFDGKFLGALLEQEEFDSSAEFQTVLNLSFIEPYPDRGHNVHERTRNLLLDRLWNEDQGRYKALSRRAYEYCIQGKGQDVFWLAEAYYHGLLSDTPEIVDKFIDRGAEWHNLFEYDKIEILIRPILEAAQDERMTGRAVAWAYYRQGMLDMVSSRYRRAQAALEQALAQTSDDLELTANCIRSLGDVHYWLSENDLERARYEEALSLYHEIGDRSGEASCIQALGDLHLSLSDYVAARTCYEDALSLHREIGDRFGEASCIRSLGNIHYWLSEPAAARALYDESLRLFREIGERSGEANTIRSLGDVHLSLAEYAAARACYEQSLSLHREIGDRSGEANTIRSLGDVHYWLSENDLERARYEEALALYRKINDRIGEASCIRSLGDMHLSLSEYVAARTCYEESLSLHREIGERTGEADCIQSLGDVHYWLSEPAAAHTCYEDALNLYREIGERTGEANCIRCLGDLHLSLSEHSAARARYEQALSLYREIGDHFGEANCTKFLGDVHLSLSEYGPARTRYEVALDLYREIGAQAGKAHCIHALGHLYGELNDIELAFATLEEAAIEYKNLGLTEGEAACYNSVGNIFEGQKKYSEALRAYDDALKVYPAGYIYLNQVNVLLKINQLEQAITALDRAESLEPRHPYAVLNRGRILLRKKNPMGAIEQITNAVRMRPKEGVFYLHLALAFFFNHQLEEAQSVLETGLKLTYKVKKLTDVFEELEQLVNVYGDDLSVEQVRHKIKEALDGITNRKNL